MSTPDALRIANELDYKWQRGLDPHEGELRETAAELRRQHAEIERLRGIVPEVLERLNDELCAENERLRADAARYRWLRDLRCNSVSVSRDDDHACNYMTASEWIDNNADWYVDDNPEEVQRMRDTNTIWRLQVYPNTPVGFNAWNGSTLDSAIDAAMRDAL